MSVPLSSLTSLGVSPERLAYSMGLLVATLPCAVWNFSANKLWTFQGTQGDGM